MHQMVPVSSEDRLTSQADSDEQLLALWLHGRAASTQRAYCSDSRRFLRFVGKPLRSIKLAEVQAFADSISDRAPATQSRAINVVKSLFSFGHRVGYLPFNVAAAVRAPPAKDTRAERILPEADIQRMLALEGHPRNRVILRLLYGAGLRASELCGLKRRDCQPRDEAGQITVFGKGGKTRTVLLPVSVWQDLEALSGEGSDPDAPVFRSRKKGGHLTAAQVWRIVRAAARRAGIDADVSPHWLRHGHASHALDRGAPIHLVQATLGHASVATTGRHLHARPKDSSGRYLVL